MADASKGSFWSSVPGLLSGAAALITAIGGLLVIKPSPKEEPVQTSAGQRSDECAIKGNISRTPEGIKKFYHMPGDNGYQATEIDVTKGERWFCSDIEAQQAGWTRANQQ